MMVGRTARHAAKRSAVGGVAVALLAAFSGYLLMANLRVNRTLTVSSDAAQLISQRVERMDEVRRQVNELNSRIDTLNTLAGNGDDSANNVAEDARSGTVLPAVQGPGISVTLDDSPLWEGLVGDSGSLANINDYVIHQQDIESVVNALWAGGAESMMIQDQRVLSNSAVLCVGNVLMLQGRQYSPPYTIAAIGPQDRMLEALRASKAIGVYKEYVSAFGLGWTVDTNEKLEFPESAMLLQPLRYARVPDKESGDE